jgi:hypothetical protein
MGKIALLLFSLLVISDIPYNLSPDDKYESVSTIGKCRRRI